MRQFLNALAGALLLVAMLVCNIIQGLLGLVVVLVVIAAALLVRAIYEAVMLPYRVWRVERHPPDSEPPVGEDAWPGSLPEPAAHHPV